MTRPHRRTSILASGMLVIGFVVTLARAGEPASATPIAVALSEALLDEYRSRDLYRAILRKHGSIRPFSRIVDAEQRHIDALLKQFVRLGLDVPKPAPIRANVPPSVQEACRAAAAAERTNAALYDRLIERVGGDPKVVAIFERLRNASLERHLPAFERCANRRRHG